MSVGRRTSTYGSGRGGVRARSSGLTVSPDSLTQIQAAPRMDIPVGTLKSRTLAVRHQLLDWGGEGS